MNFLEYFSCGFFDSNSLDIYAGIRKPFLQQNGSNYVNAYDNCDNTGIPKNNLLHNPQSKKISTQHCRCSGNPIDMIFFDFYDTCSTCISVDGTGENATF